jgi:hypothetical protein
MGFNTTVVVLNDALNYIKDDKSFGASLYDAALTFPRLDGDIRSGMYVNAARVVDVHHADYITPIFVGAGTGVVIPAQIGFAPNETQDDRNIRMLKELARVLGYRVSRIPQGK